jgi:hypothetical protein
MLLVFLMILGVLEAHEVTENQPYQVDIVETLGFLVAMVALKEQLLDQKKVNFFHLFRLQPSHTFTKKICKPASIN